MSAKDLMQLLVGYKCLLKNFLRNGLKSIIKKTGIKRIVCGGGVFMNVKANKIISEIDQIEDFFVFPSCGDESLSFGAVWIEYAEFLKKNKEIKPLKPLIIYMSGEVVLKIILKMF